MSYRIAWQNLEGGPVGRGAQLWHSLNEAQEVARMLDGFWPDIRHWACPAAESSILGEGDGPSRVRRSGPTTLSYAVPNRSGVRSEHLTLCDK